MEKVKLNKKFFNSIKIMAECQNEILDVVNRPSCVGDDQVACSRYWEICEIVSEYNRRCEKIGYNR